MTLTYGELFAGIGGLSLGLERAGLVPRWFCENDDYCNRVLAKHWPDVAWYGDIKELDPNDLEPVDLIAGGFPCQPVSLAGKGLAQQDERWLWSHFARVVRHLRPRYVLVENVPGLLVRGMGDVLGDLASLGFDAEWESIPAAAVGAPHLRWRVFLVAYADAFQGAGRGKSQPGGSQAPRHVANARRLGDERRRVLGDVAGETRTGEGKAPERERLRDALGDRREDLADADRGGFQVGPQLHGEPGEHAANGSPCWGHADRRGNEVADATVQRLEGWRQGLFGSGGGNVGGSWLPEPDVGRVAHGVPSRVDRLRALGNAVVPQVAEYVGRCIVKFDRERAA